MTPNTSWFKLEPVTKKQELLPITLILGAAFVAILIGPKFWCKSSSQGPTLTQTEKDTSTPSKSSQPTTPPLPPQENIGPPPETRYFRLAAEYLAGKEVPAARSINPPNPLVTAEPSGCNVEKAPVDYDYDETEDIYILPIMADSKVTKRPISLVICDYPGDPYHTEVAIDTSTDRVAGWVVGQR